MQRSRARKLTASALAVGVAVGVSADAASAGTRIVQTALNNGHLARGSANSNRFGTGDGWHWSGIRTTEIQNTLFFWDTICGYQGGRSIVHFPSGSVTNATNSAFHAGCTWGTAFFDFGERYLSSLYGIKTKWKSNHTTNSDWIEIGTLTPG